MPLPLPLPEQQRAQRQMREYDTEFLFGLDVILDGLERLLDSS